MPSDARGPGRGPTLPSLSTEEHGSASFQAISYTPLRPLLPSTCSLARRRTLSGWHWQSLNPPHHACEEPPRQMILCQEQPIIAGMFHQAPARLHQPLLKARHRPVASSLRQHEPPPQVPQVVVVTTNLVAARSVLFFFLECQQLSNFRKIQRFRQMQVSDFGRSRNGPCIAAHSELKIRLSELGR